MDDKKGNKWFAVLMGALALAFIVLIVVVVIGVGSVKKQYNDAKKVSEEAAAEAFRDVDWDQRLTEVKEELDAVVQGFNDRVDSELEKMNEMMKEIQDGK